MEVPEEEYVIPLGEARVVREGLDVTLISWGAHVRTIKEAGERLAAEKGYDVEVIDLRTLAPFDFATVTRSVVKTGRAVIVQEAPISGGFASEVSAQLMERAILHLEAPVKRVAGFDTIPPLSKLEDYYQPSVDRVVDEVIATMEF
jgi:pyruvate dehydrogenase E1 component beta subunit